MTVTCHQPHFLPWIPYWNKLYNSDLFLVLDDFAFRKNYFINRTLVLSDAQMRSWITIPVKHSPLGTPISRIQIADDKRSLRTSINRIEDAYKAFKESDFLSEILQVLSHPPPGLLDLNLHLLKLTLGALKLDRLKLVRISDIAGPYVGPDRILAALKDVRASRVIVGMGAMANVNNLASWEEAGIKLAYQQPGIIDSSSSIALGDGISILHDIVTSGPQEASRFVRQYWSPNGK